VTAEESASDLKPAEESVLVKKKKVLIEEIEEAVKVDVSSGELIEAIEESEEKKKDKSKDMLEDFKNLNSEFDSLD
jgi:hypothetical protein